MSRSSRSSRPIASRSPSWSSGRALPGLAVAALLAAGVACGSPATEDEPAAAEAAGDPTGGTEGAGSAGPVEAELWLDDVRVGHQVDPEGAIPPARQGDEFAPGETVYVSMSVSDAPASAAVHVVFETGVGEKVAEDEKKVPAEARYLYFDSGDTRHWTPGAYRVVVAVDGVVVFERELTVTGNPLATKGEPG